ncbi:MAG TPA: spermidine/putrescine ABC transporter substrate-binding protein [Candidatus Limnocylindria bacterium]|nr:spermidine/putrescine ABC transporter substrate-binding protein [Candidatus Limnocylindria bacterium]
MSDVPRHQLTPIELAIERAMRQDRINRRAFLGRAGRGGIALGAMLSLPALIAACTPSGESEVTLEWANWTAYIDIDEENPPDPTPYPTINAFIEQTGFNVNYQEAILDNAEFMQALLPDLTNGNPTGWDLITPGGWVVQRLGELGYLEELDHSKLPNWSANAADHATGLWFDPDNTWSVWWQGGITGIAYDPNQTGRELTTFDDLLDPEFAGRVGAFSDMRDMFGLTLLSLGIVPENATVEDATAAQQVLLEANERNQFRGYYGNEYYDALAAGDLIASVAWSGDITQIQLADNPDMLFVIPEAGGMRWNDNMCIPKGSTEKLDQTHQLIDYWYDLDAATTLSEYIGYFTGVDGVSERIAENAQAARDSGDTETADYLDGVAPIVEPTADQIDNTYTDKQLSEEEEAQWNDLFLEVLGG